MNVFRLAWAAEAGAVLSEARGEFEMRQHAGLLAWIGAAMIVGSAAADQVTFVPRKDNTLYQDPLGATSNGQGGTIFAGNTAQSQTRRALIAFDLTAIPVGSSVTSAQLTMSMTRTRAAATPVSLHRVLADWGEGPSDAGIPGGGGDNAEPNDATWLHRFFPSTNWTNIGGDFAPTASATTSVGNIGFYTWTGFQFTSDVQGWVNNPSTNFGWLIRGSESASSTAKSFDSRSGADASKRPRLVVTFTPPAGYGACCMVDGSCRVLTSADCNAASGVFQGVGAACGPSSPCPLPLGACCFPNTSCQMLTEAACTAQGGSYAGPNVPCEAVSCPRILTKFVDPLPIPHIAQPTSGSVGGAASYRVAISQFRQQLHRDLPPTLVWGFDGTYPGPTFETAAGERVNVDWVNDLRDENGRLLEHHVLPVETCIHGVAENGDAPRVTVHLHGAHVPTDSDGYPEDTVLPGEELNYSYPNDQLPTTLWYHDHSLGTTRLGVYMGLAGFYIIRDPAELPLNLPTGEYDVPLLIQDRSFNQDGSLRYAESWQDHFYGDTTLVNGKVWPYFNVKRGKYRFRILNGSTSRTYTLALSNGVQFQLIGTDGGLLSAPVTMDSLTVMPAERYDVVIDFGAFTANAEIVMSNTAPINYPGVPGDGVIPQVMKFVVQGATGHTALLPEALRPVPRIPESDARVIRTLNLQQAPDPCMGTAWLINGLQWDDVVETPRLGTTEIWRFVNRSSISHPMHMHLVEFQVLDRQAFSLVNDLPVPVGPRVLPLAYELGWKDTVQSRPGEITRVIAKFTGFSGLFPYHCHILEHEDHEMMRQMLVLPVCVCDFNNDATIDSRDYFAFISSFFAGNADVNDDDATTSQDFFDFLACFFAGCGD